MIVLDTTVANIQSGIILFGPFAEYTADTKLPKDFQGVESMKKIVHKKKASTSTYVELIIIEIGRNPVLGAKSRMYKIYYSTKLYVKNQLRLIKTSKLTI